MQGKLFEKNFIEGMNLDKIENLRQIYEWIQQHTEICHLYAQLSNEQEKINFKEKIDISMDKGKMLMESAFSESLQSNRKPMIPLSGINRFSAPAHDSIALGKHEIVTNSINNTFKSEITVLGNSKKIPMPSRTYLKKK